jgi:hypothetical protein
VDASRSCSDEGRGIALRVGIDLVGDGEQPEDAIDAALSGEREVDEAEYPRSGIGLGGACDVALVDEGREQAIARIETRPEQLLGDGDALALLSVRRTGAVAGAASLAAAAGSSGLGAATAGCFGEGAGCSFALRAVVFGSRGEDCAGAAWRRTPAAAAHRLKHVCGTPCFLAASLTPSAGTSATASARCSFV